MQFGTSVGFRPVEQALALGSTPCIATHPGAFERALWKWIPAAFGKLLLLQGLAVVRCLGVPFAGIAYDAIDDVLRQSYEEMPPKR